MVRLTLQHAPHIMKASIMGMSKRWKPDLRTDEERAIDRYLVRIAAKVAKEAARPHAERHPNDKNKPNPDRCVNWEVEGDE